MDLTHRNIHCVPVRRWRHTQNVNECGKTCAKIRSRGITGLDQSISTTSTSCIIASTKQTLFKTKAPVHLEP